MLAAFGGLNEPTWLQDVDQFEVREVGGLHNLSIRDKERWTRHEGGALRIVERVTGREEIWFGHKNDYPQFVSVDPQGRLQSHSKFKTIWVPAVHFPQENLLNAGFGTHPKLDIWCDEGEISNPPHTNQWALEARNMLIRPLDRKAAEYIQYFQFSNIREEWENGEWKRSSWRGVRIIFFKKELNVASVQKKMLDWIDQYCNNGIYPVGATLFGDPEEEFLFVAEFCT